MRSREILVSEILDRTALTLSFETTPVVRFFNGWVWIAASLSELTQLRTNKASSRAKEVVTRILKTRAMSLESSCSLIT
jgi:polyferredoxin